MKKTSLIPFIFFLLIGIIGTANAQEVINSNWPKGKIQCNGLLDDWETPLRMFQTNLQFDITNDSTNLYIAIKSLDKNATFKLMQSGLKLWFNTNGKEKETSSISLIRPLPTENPSMGVDQSGKPNRENMKELFKADKKAISIKGFTTIADGILPLDSAGGIKAAVAFDGSDNLVYEFAISLSILNDKTSKNANLAKPIAVEFEVAGIKRPGNGKGGDHGEHGSVGFSGGGEGGGMSMGGGRHGGAGGGRHGGGHPQGEGGGRDNLSSTDHIWNKVQINMIKK